MDLLVRERKKKERKRKRVTLTSSRMLLAFTTPRHLALPRPSATTSRRSFHSPSTPPLSPRTPRDVQCTRAKRGTNHEARRTQNILKLGFYTFEFHGTHTTPRSGLGRERERTKKLDRCIASDMSKPLFVVLFYLKPLRCGEKSIGRL